MISWIKSNMVKLINPKKKPSVTEEDDDQYWNPDEAEIDAIATELSVIQKQMKSNKLIKYSDENPDPKKSKLIKKDVIKSKSILKIFEQAVHGKTVTKTTKTLIFKKVMEKNKKEMSLKTLEEQNRWVDIMIVRFTNLFHNFKKAQVARSKWVREMMNDDEPEPDIKAPGSKPSKKKEQKQTKEDCTDEENQEDDEDDDEEACEEEDYEEGEEEEQELDLETELDEMVEAQEQAKEQKRNDKKKMHDHIVAGSNKSKYEIKFSKELMLPMRKEVGPSKSTWEVGCPIDMNDGEDDQQVTAQWPDGFKIDLLETYNDLKLMSPERSKAMKDMNLLGIKSRLSGLHKATKNTITVDQRVDRHLLIGMYENGKMICSHRVDHFGPVRNGNQRIGDEDPTLIKAFVFFKPIFTMYVNNKIKRDELHNVKNKMINGGTLPNDPENEQARHVPVGARRRPAAKAKAESTTTSEGVRKRPAAALKLGATPKRRATNAKITKTTVVIEDEDGEDEDDPAQSESIDVEEEDAPSMRKRPSLAIMPPIKSTLATMDMDDDSSS